MDLRQLSYKLVDCTTGALSGFDISRFPIFTLNRPEDVSAALELLKRFTSEDDKAVRYVVLQAFKADDIPDTAVVYDLARRYWLRICALTPLAEDSDEDDVKDRDHSRLFLSWKFIDAVVSLQRRRAKGDRFFDGRGYELEKLAICTAFERPLDFYPQGRELLLSLPRGEITSRIASLAAIAVVVASSGESSPGTPYEQTPLFIEAKALHDRNFRDVVATYIEKGGEGDDGDAVRDAKKHAVKLLCAAYAQMGDFNGAAQMAQKYNMDEGLLSALKADLADAKAIERSRSTAVAAAFFASSCVGLYSFFMRACVGCDSGLTGWGTIVTLVLCGIAGFGCFKYLREMRSGVPENARGWIDTRFLWLFAFFALAFVPSIWAFVAGIFFFLRTIKVYPRYRGWVQ